MRKASRRISNRRVLWLASLFACVFTGQPVSAERASPKIFCRAELAEARRLELSAQLRAITGWPGLHFDVDGALRLGTDQPSGGSATARALLTTAQSGANMIVLEDASGRADVAFSRVTGAKWVGGGAGRPPAFLVQIDFTDFSHVRGDADALASFSAGWGLMHEIEHVVNDSADAAGLGMAGECEDSINRMRREGGLAERAEYFYTFMPGADHAGFKTRFVRLAFERPQPQNKRRRYWLVWDADLVGGLPAMNQMAAK